MSGGGIGERGRYLVAATFGNVHRTHAPGNVALRLEILQAGQMALAAAYPDAHFQYVFHGSSGSSERELANAVSFGVVKVNVDTDNQYPFTRALAGHVLDHWQGVLKVDGGIGDKQLRPAGAGEGWLRRVLPVAVDESGGPVDHPPAPIGAAYHRFAQRCCGTGARAASLGAQALKWRNA